MPIDRWSENVSIVHLATDPEFTDELAGLEAAIEHNATDIVLDFSGVVFLNSSNLSHLLRVRKQLHDVSRRLILCGLNTKAWTTFLVTGLDKVFDCADEVPTALAKLQLT